MKLLILLFVLLFSVILAFVQGLQAKDRKLNSLKTDPKLYKYWHIAQACLHVLVALSVFLLILPDLFSACFGFFMTLFIIWGSFDITNNLVTGNAPFYKGNSTIDKLMKKIPVALELLIKLILILITTTYFLTNPFNG